MRWSSLFLILKMQTKVSLIMDWRHHAACLDEDPDLFFPIGTTGPALEQIERAKAVCRRCDVVAQCLEWSLKTNQDAGVWGGLSEDERRTLRRSRQRRRRHIPT
jgi:WhiB family transcriptional regulator, redox-sensing transcriptional regulator